MKAFTDGIGRTGLMVALVGVLLLTMAIPNRSLARNAPANRAGQLSQEQTLAEQMRSLQDKITRLEAALQQGYQRPSAGATSGRGMAVGSAAQGGSTGMMDRGMMGSRRGMMQRRGPAQPGQGASGMGGTSPMQPGQGMGKMEGMDTGEMGMGSASPMQPGQGMGMMEDMDMGEMGMGGTSSMPPDQGTGMMEGMDMGEMGMGGTSGMQPGQGTGMEGMDMGEMGMGGMGAMQPSQGMGAMRGMGGMMGRRPAGQGMAMGGAPMPSALPAFPGAVNIYHIGETGFFLDQAQRIGLSNEQQTMLNQIKQRALRQDAVYQQRIASTEEQLWSLTSSDRPDTTRIATKVREIERLRSDRRLAFIRAVGEAARVLTEQQRQMLTIGASRSAMPSADQSTGLAQPPHQP